MQRNATASGRAGVEPGRRWTNPLRRRVLVTVAAVIVASSCGARAAAAQSDEPLPPYRSPLLAAMLAIPLPTAGHAYAGEPERGVAIALVALMGTVVFLSGWAATDDCIRPACDPTAGQRREVVGGVMIYGAYLFNVVDAPLAARRQNRARSAAASGAVLEPVVTGDRAAGIQLRVPIGR